MKRSCQQKRRILFTQSRFFSQFRAFFRQNGNFHFPPPPTKQNKKTEPLSVQFFMDYWISKCNILFIYS